MGVTIKDIAKLAHVSATTVSNVINGKKSKTTEDTKQRILDLVKELDYKPNAMARSLVNGKSKLIGVILPDISESYYSLLAKQLEATARNEGYSILVCSTDNSKNARGIIDNMREHCVDGIIISSCLIKESDEFKELLRMKYPLVTLGREIDGCEDVCNVGVNSYKTGYEATKYLLNLGHKNIGLIASEGWLCNTKKLIEGYSTALKENDINMDESFIFNGEFDIETGVKGIEYFINNKKNISAIVAGNDIMAYGVYRGAHNFNISIPKNISVIGIGDLKFSKVAIPALTTVQEPIDKIAEKAVEMIISIITKKPMEQSECKFDSKVIVRESVDRVIIN